MNETFFQFHSPGYFILLVFLVPLFVLDLVKLHLIKFDISSITLVTGGKKSLRYYLEFIPPLLRLIALILLVVAVARPQWGNKYTEINSEGIDIILALDTSGSMRALDLTLDGDEANRLEVIKSVVTQFIDGRSYDRIGMVVFGSEAYTQCPLTLDYDILKGYLDLIEIGIVGEETAIGNALATSVKRLSQSKAKSKVIILLTDGQNTAGKISPLNAAELAKDNKIKVYSIAVGRDGRVPFPQKTMFGWRKVHMQLEVDEETLKEIAKITEGRFFKASSTETLKEVYRTIDEMEKTEVKINEFAEYKEMFVSFLIPAIILLLAAWLLQRTVFLRIP